MRSVHIFFLLLIAASSRSQNNNCDSWISVNNEPQLNLEIADKSFSLIQKEKGLLYLTHTIISKWNTFSNEIDIPQHRSLEIKIMGRDKNGLCSETFANFVQLHIGGGKFGKSSLAFTGITKVCDCACEEKANVWKNGLPQDQQHVKDPLDSNK